MIIYNGPYEAEIKNPTQEFIYDIIWNKEEDYWKKGSGDSCIEIEGSEEVLIFFYDEPYGFLIMRQPDYLVPINREKEIEVVEHNIGGEPLQIPTCSYVDRKTAYEIIMNYINKGVILNNIEWIDLYDIEFENNFN